LRYFAKRKGTIEDLCGLTRADEVDRYTLEGLKEEGGDPDKKLIPKASAGERIKVL